MAIAFLIGRTFFGIFHILFGLNHFTMLSAMTAYASSKGVPLPTVAVLVSGILLLIGGLFILLGIYPKIGILALVLFYVPVTFIMHNFWAVNDPMGKMMDTTNFFKNMIILGSSLMFLMIPEPWKFSISGKK